MTIISEAHFGLTTPLRAHRTIQVRIAYDARVQFQTALSEKTVMDRRKYL
jgi:hypothetical protein